MYRIDGKLKPNGLIADVETDMSDPQERYPTPWTFRIAPDMLRRLTETATREGMSMSEIARRGIESELNRLDARHERELRE